MEKKTPYVYSGTAFDWAAKEAFDFMLFNRFTLLSSSVL
jgi:hypothetical protein